MTRGPDVVDVMRLDRFLWFARVTKTRDWAQAMATSGHLRLDGRAVAKAAVPVHVGQVLSFATHAGRVRAIRVLALPMRRGPPAEARQCYEDLLPSPGGDKNVSQEGAND